MFKLIKSPPMDRAELHRVIINFGDNTANIEYKVGYKEGNEFVSIGVDTLFLQDVEEKRDDEDVVTQEAVTDYTDFYTKLNGDLDPLDVVMETLEELGIKNPN